jgi:hypothetical protein
MILGIADLRGRVGSHDSRTHEIASCEKRTCGSIKGDSSRESKEPIQLKGLKNDPVSGSRPEGR